MSKKIKPIDPLSGNIEKNKINGIDYPVFCFKYLQKDSIQSCTNSKFYFDFLFRLQSLCDLGWKGIRASGRHSYGMEKIPRTKIKPKKLPPIITPDISELHVFRATGGNLPFIGIQNNNIFHVIFIETNFGDIYNH